MVLPETSKQLKMLCNSYNFPFALWTKAKAFKNLWEYTEGTAVLLRKWPDLTIKISACTVHRSPEGHMQVG